MIVGRLSFRYEMKTLYRAYINHFYGDKGIILERNG